MIFYYKNLKYKYVIDDIVDLSSSFNFADIKDIEKV